MFVAVASVRLTRHYTRICSLGIAAVLRTAGTQDSVAEKSSLLHLNQRRHTGMKAHKGLTGCLNTPGMCTMSFGCCLFR